MPTTARNSASAKGVHIATEGRFIAPEMRAADNFRDLIGNNGAAFVSCAYLTILKRAPDATGYINYYSRLRLTGNKLDIVFELYRSSEARAVGANLPGLETAMNRHRLPRLLGHRLLYEVVKYVRGVAVWLSRFRFGPGQHATGEQPAHSGKKHTDLPPDDHDGVDALTGKKPILDSYNFDLQWYLSAYPDVMSTGIDPFEHYLRFGKADGRFRCREELIDSVLDVPAYTRANPDVAASQVDVLNHYIYCGRSRGSVGARLPLTLFDPDWYIRHNPDLSIDGIDPLLHYITKGVVQRRPWTSFKELSLIKPEALVYSEAPTLPRAKLVAFYRPKVYFTSQIDEVAASPITEWTNVLRAKPFYAEQDQPKICGDLGYYDTAAIEVLMRQGEMARMHGLFGFCVYVGWSDGGWVYETPVELLLRSPEVDINFCYCRTQEPGAPVENALGDIGFTGRVGTAENDIAFIAHVSTAFADPRYITVEGKPVLAVCNPSRLPNMSATASRWREWCRQRGIGELHLCAVSALGDGDPGKMGLDASIEFPPESLVAQEITQQVRVVDPTFKGQVWDYKSAAKSAKNYKRPAWTQYRGVMPAWDNTPLEMGCCTSFFGSTPELYAEWLESAISETEASLDKNERLVFINAWNDWEAGAYLEPDRRRGYAFLNQTREVVAKYAAQVTNDALLRQRFGKVHALAVVVHLYYGELFEDIAAYLDELVATADLYISVRDGTFPSMLSIVAARYPAAVVISYPNQGRDVLPFLHVFSHIQNFGYDAICKVHSKKSRHREDGDQWRDDVFNKLLGCRATIEECLAEIEAGAGVVAPAGHLLDGKSYWGLNSGRVSELALKMGCEREWIDSFVFPAGTMFWFAPPALGPLMALNLESNDFEQESGQVDGTTAHAVERLIGLSARRAGLRVVESGGGAPSSLKIDYPFVTRVR